MKVILLKKLQKYIMTNGIYCDTDADKEESAKLVERLAVDMKAVKNAKWVLNESDDGYVRDFYMCSKCKGDALSDGDGDDALSAYCPWCGAKMENGRKEIY